ncbi:amino acid adenylation domain-containing protein [Clostridium botulinum]|uniref:amino acid adenylation domain-containing protein n=1 Tax=Clostridium botulinum TaxID=1491 RepID=UPI0019686412|nr:non-ribosomal peptide synthetase [Clostridium botulinum]MBN1050272.1 amino acid adenylation domain-containing protein [Clostridium botulinum]
MESNLVQRDRDKYWINELQSLQESERILCDYNIKGYKVEEHCIGIDKQILQRLQGICKANEFVMYSFLASVIKISLSKYMNKKNITIGIPVYRAKDSKTIMHSKVLPLTSNINDDESFKEYMFSIKNKILEIYKNQGDLNKSVLLESKVYNDIMDLTHINVCMRPFHEEKYINYITKSSKNDISFLFELLEDSTMKFKIVYNANKFSEDTINTLSRTFINILDTVSNNYNEKIKYIGILCDKEKDRILCQFNENNMQYDKTKTIQELFEMQVEKTPNNIAVAFRNENLTYRELNERSNNLALFLREKGIKPDSIVGIMLNRSTEMLIGIIGILKAGGAYLPIDPKNPSERIEYVIKDANVETIITTEEIIKGINFYGHIVNIEKDGAYSHKSANLSLVNSSNDLAYVIYTSGSTGNPKGVMIEHKQVNNFIHAISSETSLNKYNNILCITTISFDIFCLETIVPLTQGLKVVISDEEDNINGDKIASIIQRHNIEVMQSTPSRFKMLLDSNKFRQAMTDMKLILVGGESLTRYVLDEFNKYEKLEVYNVYGPTETTVWSTCKRIKNENKITIGKPIKNTKIYILDSDNQVVPIGAPGELCISGDGVARGYLYNTKLTEEKFIKNPFCDNSRMYKTGDLARWSPDGDIEFLGRTDNQVKLRGFRIEFGEIENALMCHESVNEAVVIIKEMDNHEKYICAYITSESKLDEIYLKSFLRKTLPEYMIPSYFTKLKEIPLTYNGKINRRALPEPMLNRNLYKYEGPRNDIEEKLVKVWCEILDLKNVGINDNFFDIGGHSLKAILLISIIQKEFNRELKIDELFNASTIKELSEYITLKDEVNYNGIKKVDKQSHYNVMPNQKGLFVANQKELNIAESNVPLIINIQGNVDKDKLEKVLIQLINRHEAFRTSFEIVDEEVVCKIHDNFEFKLQYDEYIGKDIEAAIYGFVQHFDLSSYPLMRALLLKTDEEKYTFIIDIHHIIIDGYSLNILYRELVDLYMDKELQVKEYDMSDYLFNESTFIKDSKIKNMEIFWKNKFANQDKPIYIPHDLNEFKKYGYKGEKFQFKISNETLEKIKEIVNKEKTTTHTFLFAIYTILLRQYTGENDIVVGSISAGRRLSEYKDIIGSFINLIPIMNRIETQDTFMEFLNKTNNNLMASYENQYFQFHTLNIDKLVRTLINFHTEEEKNENLLVEGLKFEQYEDLKYNEAHLDIQVDFEFLNSGGLNCIFEYNANKFKDETIRRMTKQFSNIIQQVINDTTVKIADIRIVSMDEENQILNNFNNTFLSYDRHATIHKLFERQVEKTPDSIAVEYYNEKITYRELNEKANVLARKLCSLGIKEESIVAIKVDKSIEMMVGIIAILKSGGAYLPIDPEYPLERSKFMINDSGTKVVLTQQKFLKGLDIEEFDGIVVNLNNYDEYGEDLSNLEHSSQCENLAYIIYTSGSTGRPKGVMVEHRNVVAYINAFCHEYNINNNDVILHQASYGFDTSIEELYPILLVGGKLIIAARNDIKDINNLVGLVDQNNVTIISASPLLIYAMNQMEINKSVRLIISGGDVLKKEYISNIKKGRQVYNTYGPTETTVCATYYKCGEVLEDNIPIGKPIANYHVYILNKDGKIQPIGLPGEVCIAGDGVTRGYLNNYELTKEKFIESSGIKDKRIYKTGDLGRWLSDGNIEYLGRVDKQIKIRGYRVELCEIEQAILKDKNIKDVVVIYSDDKYICAYIVGNVKINTKELKRNLYKEIPRYMVPQFIMQIDKMPESINGKLDNSKLPIPEFRRSENDDYLEPRNDIESKLCELFSEMLKINNISINDDLFDLGLDSLKLILVLPKIQKEFNVKLFVEDVFNNTTIKSLYEKIITVDKEKYIAISKTEYSEYYPTSSAQKRLYMINQLDSNNTNYNIPIAIKIYEVLDIDKVKNIFTELINRHEILRTRFEFKNDELVQIIDNKIDFQVEYVEVDKENFELEDFQKSFIKPFDLQKGPLIRVKIIKLSIDKFILQIDIHHIIADGHSIEILVNEFSRLYLGEKLSDVNLQYKDFVVWEQRMIKEGSFKEQEKYWSDMYKNSITKLEMPLDYERPDIQSFQGNKISFEIEEELLGKVKRVCSETGSTINILLFTAYATLLGLYTNNEDLVIGVPVLGRSHSDLQNVVGMFVNTLAIRVFPKRNKTFKGFLYEVKDTLMKSYEYQNFPLDKLIENLNWDRTSNENPLFDTIFNFRSNLNDEPVLENLKIEYIESNNKTAKFDFYLDVYQSKEKVYFDLEYCTELFDKETIDMLVEFYLKVINTICDDMDIYLNEIELEDENSCFGEVDFNF